MRGGPADTEGAADQPTTPAVSAADPAGAQVSDSAGVPAADPAGGEVVESGGAEVADPAGGGVVESGGAEVADLGGADSAGASASDPADPAESEAVPVDRGTVRQRIPHLPTALWAIGVLLVISVVAGAAYGGAVSAAGAALGVVLVAASYVASTLAIAWADSVRPQLVLAVGLVAYTIKFTYIGLGMAALAAADWPGLPAMGVSLIAAVVVWNAAQIWYIVRHPVSPDPPTPKD